MQKEAPVRARVVPVSVKPLSFKLRSPEFRSMDVPGRKGMKLSTCFVKVNDLPETLSEYMRVNPRCPSRNQKGVLTGPVIKGIINTLTESPDEMAIKNQGIYVLAEDVDGTRVAGNVFDVTICLADPDRHGIVNGGHTFAAIRQAIENADEMQMQQIESAWVKLHLYQGADKDSVSAMAEGLNRSKQVDDPSLSNLGGVFDEIKSVMKGHTGEDQIAYHQGDEGEIYITEILAFLEMFNCQRFNDRKHPNMLYSGINRAVGIFQTDYNERQKHLSLDDDVKQMSDSEFVSPLDLLIPKLPEILVLADTIRHRTREAAKHCGFEFGRMKIGKKEGSRAASQQHHNTQLHFTGKTVDFRTPNGWLFPMLSAFRANVKWDLRAKRFEWKQPVLKLLDSVIEDLVNVCVTEHRDNNVKPELVGKRESVYRQCYYLVERHLMMQSQQLFSTST